MAAPLRVLILEDNESDAELMLEQLRRSGYEPEWWRVESEQDYLAFLDRRPEIILADYTLPQFDAIRALRLLQERELEIPLIIVTGSISEEVAVECMREGAADYLLKDRLGRLGPAVKVALDKGRLLLERKQAEQEIRLRVRELAALNAVAHAVSRSLDLGQVLKEALDKTLVLTQLSSGSIWLHEAGRDQLKLAVWQGWGEESLEQVRSTAMSLFNRGPRFGQAWAAGDTDDPALCELAERAGEELADAAFPLTARGGSLGLLIVGGPKGRRLSSENFSLLVGIGKLVGTAVENARLFEQVQAGRNRLQALSRRLVEVQEQERRHIARELHDQVGQLLTGLKLSLEMARRHSSGQGATRLDDAGGLVNEMIGQIRELSLELRPAMLDDLGLLPAILWHFDRYTARTGIQINFQHAGLEGRLAPDLETAAYRIVQEALTNVARYAGVSQVDVRVWLEGGLLTLRIEDQGVGFDPEATLANPASAGLAGMHERANLVGGQLSLESRPGGGTRVTAKLPIAGPLERRTQAR